LGTPPGEAGIIRTLGKPVNRLNNNFTIKKPG